MPALVGIVCAYEVAALVSRGRVPTITRLVHAGRNHDTRWVKDATFVAATVSVVWLAHHFLIEGTDSGYTKFERVADREGGSHVGR